MKKNEVPQDKSALAQKNITDLLYITDEQGNYTTSLSTGWEPKTLALDESIDVINEHIAVALDRVKKGTVSPIAYFMEKNKMDLWVLSSYVGMGKWRVKRHFKPKVFRKLSEKILQKYADTFEITVSELKDFKA